jgi:hypothetical protein
VITHFQHIAILHITLLILSLHKRELQRTVQVYVGSESRVIGETRGPGSRRFASGNCKARAKQHQQA